MANDPNGLANQLYGDPNKWDTSQIQGYDPNTFGANPAGLAGFAFSPTAGWTQNPNGSLSLTSALTQAANNTNNPAPTPDLGTPNPGSIAQPIPSNYNQKTGLFDSGTTNTNTSANVATGNLGGGTQTPPQLSDNLTATLKQLMQLSQDQSTQGQNLLKGLLDQLQGNINFNQQQTTRTSGQRDALVSALLGGSFNDQGQFTANGQGLLGSYNQLLGKFDQGLDPLTMASLQQQAIEGPQRDYQGQVEQLKTALGQRGAYGGGDTPGDLGAILGGYAPLMTARDTTREGLLQQNAFQNQAQKNTNNQLVANGLQSLGGLTTNLASNYNPNSFDSATQQALQNALSGVGQNTNTGLAGIKTAGDLASVLNDTTQGSLGSLLRASLAGTATKAATDAISAAVKKDGKGWLTSLVGLLHPAGGGRPADVDIQAARSQLEQHGIDTQGLSNDEIQAIINGIDLTQYPPDVVNPV